jgi:tetratricopeptide (TPR) repeat protein
VLQRNRNRRRGQWTTPRLALLILALLGLIGGSAYVAGNYLWAEYHFRAARAALARDDLEQGRAHLALCLRVWSRSSEAHFLAARAARRAGAYDDAEQHLLAYQRLDGVPEALELERALIAVQRGDPGAYEDSLLAVVHRDHPDSTLILEALARGYLRSFRLGQAEACLNQWLEREPDNVQALLWRGEIHERRLNAPTALADYRRAVELDPENDEARLRLADTLLHLKHADEAIAHYEYLQPRRPGRSAVLLGLARCRRDLGQLQEARNLFDRVILADPHNVGALLDRGRLALQMDLAAEAEEWLHKALRVAPHDREVLYTLSQCLQVRGKTDEARRYRARLEEIEAQLSRLAELTKQITATPHDANLRCEMGQIFLSSGQDQEGLRWLDSALHENPRHAPTHALLAAYYDRQGRPDLAVRHRPLALSGDAGGRRLP